MQTGAKGRDVNQRTYCRASVIPYTHRLSHGLKNLAKRYDVKVVFSAPMKLGAICPQVERRLASGSRQNLNACGVKHVSPFTMCRKGVVYRVPLSCGKFYVGQTGRCLNVRLFEHRNLIGSDSRDNLPAHCRVCKCQPLFHNTTVLFHHKDKVTREVMEAFFIKSHDVGCVSDPSVALLDREYRYLNSRLRPAPD